MRWASVARRDRPDRGGTRSHRQKSLLKPGRKPARRAPVRTLGNLVRQGATRFAAAHITYGHGTLNARDEAAYLALHALNLPLDQFEGHRDSILKSSQVAKVDQLFERRVRERRPASYLTHEAWLGEFRFYVDDRVIVPRSFIAELLRADIAPWIVAPEGIRTALDLCTGSGCLAILLAHSFPHAVIDAADIDSRALRVARLNVAQYRLSRRVSLIRSDLFSKLRGRRYDVIIANPPYVRAAVMRRLPQEYRHEPAVALAGGKDGLDVVRVILREAPRYLTPGGLLVVEVGHNRKRVERVFPRLPFIWPETSGGDDCVFLLSREELCSS